MHCSRTRFREEIESKASVTSLVVHAIERASSERWKRRQSGIVLDLVDRALPRERDLHAGIQDPIGVERVLHQRERAHVVSAPDAIEKRRAQPPVAVLTGKRAAE